ncbi:MAG: ribonuclease III domain-containing protein, partial [Chlamydiota bacterium]|nr:ribonuclease III domain-containing protein [Chlamydiota bacterium]
MTHHLYLQFPKAREGTLSSMKARLVSGSACYRYLHSLGLSPYLFTGKGEGNPPPQSLLADFFEALIGALFLDGGIPPVQNLIDRLSLENHLMVFSQSGRNWKAELQ